MANDGLPSWQRAPEGEPQRLSIRLPEALYQRLVARSAREGKPLTTVATSLLADALRELPPGWSAEGR